MSMTGDIYEGVADNDPCAECLKQDCVCGEIEMSLDVTKVSPGTWVVFTHPDAGMPKCVDDAVRSGLEVGKEYYVDRVDLGRFSCRLRLLGMDGWFNSVQFEAAIIGGC